MLGFSPISDFAVSDIGPEAEEGEATLTVAVTLTVDGHTDDLWSCNPGQDASWVCR